MKNQYTFCAISDIHGTLPNGRAYFNGSYDMLIIAGDICPIAKHQLLSIIETEYLIAFLNGTPVNGNKISIHNKDVQRKWIIETFIPWCQSLLEKGIFKDIIFIPGNHDFVFEKLKVLDEKSKDYIKFPEHIHCLLDSSVVIDEKVKVYGTPHVPHCGNWAFSKTEIDLAKYFISIPENYDIIISHAPMLGINDLFKEENVCMGSTVLRREILERCRPKYFIHGHIHEGNHIPYEIKDENGNVNMTICNVSILDENYQFKHQPYRGTLNV